MDTEATPLSDHDRRLDEVVTAYLKAVEAGEHPDPKEWLARYPDLADELSGFFAGQKQVAALMPHKGGADTIGFLRDKDDGTLGTVRYIGDYELLEEIARGGMGVVFKARQVSLKRLVALKMILAGEYAGSQELARFRTEGEAVASLQHPHIVQIYEVGSHEGYPYFSMEFCAGGSLARKMDGTPLPAQQAAQMVETLARAMHVAHQAGVVHRDLKPANVLLTADGTLKITDFGLAKKQTSAEQNQPGAQATGVTVSGAIMGTPGYMAPEQAAGKGKEVTHIADVHALGAILYEMLTGRPPFRAATPVETLMMVVSNEPVPPRQLNPRTSPDLETICLKCLRKEPWKRYASAAELADDLARFTKGEPISARPAGTVERAWRWCRRKPALAAAAAVAVVCILAALATFATATILLTAANERERHKASDLEISEAAERSARLDAQGKEKLADERRRRAERAEEAARRNAYAARAQLLHTTWHEAQAGRGLKLLDEQRPAEGELDLRDFEWRLLSRWWHSDLLTAAVGSGSGNSTGKVAFSADGRQLAAGSGKSVKVWDALSGAMKQTVPGPFEEVTGLAFSPDGARLAVLSRGKDLVPQPDRATVTVWEVGNVKQVLRFTCGEFWARGLVYSPDGKLLAMSSYGMIELHDAETGKEKLVIKDAGQRFGGLAAPGPAFSPSGDRFAGCVKEGFVKVWETRTGRQLHSLKGPSKYCKSVAYSPDGALVAGNFRNQIVVWDAADGRALTTIQPRRSGSVGDITFSRDGLYIAATIDRVIELWDAYTGTEIRAYRGYDATLASLAFSPDGARLAGISDDGMVKVWDAFLPQDSCCLSPKRNWHLLKVVFNADGRLISGSEGFHIRIWDVGSGQETFSFRGPFGTLMALAPSPDGRRIVTGALIQPLIPDPQKVEHDEVCVWDSSTGRNLMTYRGHTNWINGVAYSPDGTQVASCSSDGTVRVLDAQTGREVHILRHKGRVNGVAFDPTRKRLVGTGPLARSGGLVKVWDLTTGQEVFPLQNPNQGGTCVAFSRDGTRLAAGAQDGTAAIWDAETGKHLFTLKGPTWVRALAFSRDGQRLATSAGDGKVRMWDTASGLEVFSLEPETDGIANSHISVAFSPDGTRLATGGYATMLWETTAPAADDLRRRRAAGLVEALFRGLVGKERVLKYLREHPLQDDAIRKEALALAEHYPQNAGDLDKASWPAVKPPGEPKGGYVCALLQAEEACRLEPNNGVFRNTLGVAYYRLGRYEDALKHLESVVPNSGRDLTSLAFLAMAHHQLGQTDRSKVLLERLRMSLKDNEQIQAVDGRRFLDEAEELIEGR